MGEEEYREVGERGRGGRAEIRNGEDEDGWKSGTLSLRWTLAPASRSDSVVATSPISAEKKRADHPVLCDGEDKD